MNTKFVNKGNLMMQEDLKIPTPSLVNYDAKPGDYFIAKGAVWRAEDTDHYGVRAFNGQSSREFKYADLFEQNAVYISTQAVEAWVK